MNLERISTEINVWNAESFAKEFPEWARIFLSYKDSSVIRDKLLNEIQRVQLKSEFPEDINDIETDIISRDCARALRGIFRDKNEKKINYSVLETIKNALDNPEEDKNSEAFWAEIIHLFIGLNRKIIIRKAQLSEELKGRKAAIARSKMLNEIGDYVDEKMRRYHSGLEADVVKEREKNKKRILKALQGKAKDWNNWKWQFDNIITDLATAQKVISLTDDEREGISLAEKNSIPFGITPYYASLMNFDINNKSDRQIRSQVIPSERYIRNYIQTKSTGEYKCDFMREQDTSPVDLITRRYISIVILKPYNTCPQICVYCQRNWEIKQALDENAMASREKLNAAIDWISENIHIREVLVTGGDPLSMPDEDIDILLSKLAKIPHIERIRIGSRIPATVPMRITPSLADILAKYRKPGYRELCVVTHIEHPYEITPETVKAISLLKSRGIQALNQLVFTFYVSRRFEAAKLRRMLRLIGVDPYYTFVPKGKEETSDYRVPIARILQEMKEEARLLPGLERTDEAVYNIPGHGKNYVRALQHRDLISVLPDGSRVYEYHPWEKRIIPEKTYIGQDIPVFSYLQRLKSLGENLNEYESIWYYF